MDNFATLRRRIVGRIDALEIGLLFDRIQVLDDLEREPKFVA
jgi:hypothetical protein